MKKKQEYVLCASIYLPLDKEYKHAPQNITHGFTIEGRRHSDCYHTLKNLNFDEETLNSLNIVEGFLTNHNRFLNRKEALNLAIGAEQVSMITMYNSELYSEDLY